MNQCDVIIGDDAIAKGRQALLHPLNHHLVRQGVPQMLELLVRCGVRHQQSPLVTCRGHGFSDGEDTWALVYKSFNFKSSLSGCAEAEPTLHFYLR